MQRLGGEKTKKKRQEGLGGGRLNLEWFGGSHLVQVTFNHPSAYKEKKEEKCKLKEDWLQKKKKREEGRELSGV